MATSSVVNKNMEENLNANVVSSLNAELIHAADSDTSASAQNNGEDQEIDHTSVQINLNEHQKTEEVPAHEVENNTDSDVADRVGHDDALAQDGSLDEGGDKVCAVSPSIRDITKAVAFKNSDGENPIREEADIASSRFCSLCPAAGSVAEGYCQECMQDLCSACIHRHSKMTLATNHTIILCPTSYLDDDDNDQNHVMSGNPSYPHQQQADRLSLRSSTMDGVDRCTKHRDEKLRFFCKTCQQPVCRDCILTVHKQHTTDDIGDATLTARSELASMMGQLQQKQQLLESHLSTLDEYKAGFMQQANQVENTIKTFYSEIISALEVSYDKLIEEIQQMKQAEEDRVQKLGQIVQSNVEDVSRLLSQQASYTSSSIFVLSQHEIVSLALKTLDHNMQQMGLGRSEFIITKNPMLANLSEVKHLLGTVAFVASKPTSLAFQQSSAQNGQSSLKAKPLIEEVALHAELSFNLGQSRLAKNGVQSIVETGNGAVWVAATHTLFNINGAVSVPVSVDIAGMAAGPGDKLLVSMGNGNTVKLYSGGNNWTNFASIPRASTVVASRLQGNSLKVNVAVTSTSLATTKILAYSTDGQVCRQLKLPQEIFSVAAADEATENFSGSFSSAASSCKAGLNVSCMAMGECGELVLGTLDRGGWVMMVDAKGQLLGQYSGEDNSSCKPTSLCVTANGKVIVADSHQINVKLLNMQGKLLATLLSKAHFQTSGVPTAVTVDSKERLWVGTSMGHVFAYSFIHILP